MWRTVPQLPNVTHSTCYGDELKHEREGGGAGELGMGMGMSDE